MKGSHILIGILVVGLAGWWMFSGPDRIPTQEPQPPSSQPDRARDARPDRDGRILSRVRAAAATRLPEVDFGGRESLPFAEIDPGIDELDVMEVLLAVETEFDLDLPERTITDRIGLENRRDLRSHLSLSLIAECVDGILREPAD